MKKILVLMLSVVALSIIFAGQSMAEVKCTCEDWDRDGRFGVVLDGKVLKGNVGDYGTCMRNLLTIPQCRGSLERK